MWVVDLGFDKEWTMWCEFGVLGLQLWKGSDAWTMTCELVSELMEVTEKTGVCAVDIVINEGIEDPHAVNDIARDWSVSGVVAFTVRLFGASYVRCDGSHVIENVLNVTCPNIKVGFSNRSGSHGTIVVQHSPNITRDEEAVNRCSTWPDYY
ncbi:hypothetical protein V6N11_045337 [Hibiscus sabdariffa]|uniref:Uncharacterized protein n=1 Tax=Hibiscus sabdariffa TaxID=183260 RepID=A0ABR2Q0M2_9ROSI